MQLLIHFIFIVIWRLVLQESDKQHYFIHFWRGSPEGISWNATHSEHFRVKTWRNRPSDPFTWQLELFVPLNITLCPCLLSVLLLCSLSQVSKQHAFPLQAVVLSKSCCMVTAATQAWNLSPLCQQMLQTEGRASVTEEDIKRWAKGERYMNKINGSKFQKRKQTLRNTLFYSQ